MWGIRQNNVTHEAYFAMPAKKTPQDHKNKETFLLKQDLGNVF